MTAAATTEKPSAIAAPIATDAVELAEVAVIPTDSTDAATPVPALAEKVPYSHLFRFATASDKLFMVLGTLGAALNGAMMPYFAVLMGDTITIYTIHDAQLLAARAHPARFPPAVLQHINDDFFDQILTKVYWFLGVAIVSFVVSYMQMSLWQLAGEAQAFRMKMEYFKGLLRQEVAYFDDQKRGELTSRITADVEQVQDGISDKVGHTVQYVSTFVIAFILAFTKSVYLTSILCCAIPFLIGSAAFTGKMTVQFVREALVSYGRAGAIAEEVLTALRTVVSFGGEKRECVRYDVQLEEVRQQEAKKGYIAGIGIGCIFLSLFGSYALGFYFGGLGIADGTIQIGDLVTCFMNFLVGSFSLGGAAPYISAFVTAQTSAYHIFEVIDRDSHVDPFDESGLRPETVVGRLEFNDIDFAYPTRPDVPILKKFNLSVEPGTTVALVGQSGSGKSTCVGLLERFYLPLAGTVTLDGVPIDQLNVQWLRSQVGFVGQEPVLFNGTLRQNIAWGSHTPVTDDQIWAALKESNADGFVSDLPDKLDTMIGERGANLSGGQKQRISISRALIRNPKIIFFDEATSALDTQSEAIVQEALNKAAQGRTAIVIAHRLSTVRNADKIVAMRKGEVIEFGTHDELIAKEGFYYNLVNDQRVSGDEDDSTEDDDEDEENSRLKRTASIASSLAPSLAAGTLKRRDGPPTIEDEVVGEKSVFMRAMLLNLDQWPWTLGGILCALIAGAITPVYALVYAQAITDFGVNAKNSDKMHELSRQWALLFVGIAVIAGLSNYIQVMCFTVSGEAIVKKVRNLAFSALVRQEQAFYDRKENSVGALAGKLAVDSALIRKLVGDVMGNIVQVSCSLIVGAAIAIVSGWELALVTLAGAPFIMLAGMYQSRASKGLNNSEGERDATALSSEAVSNVRTIASLGLEQQFVDEYVRRLGVHKKIQHRAVVVGGAAFGASTGATFLLYCVCFLYAAKLINDGRYLFQDLFRVITTIMFSAMMGGRISQFLPDYSKAHHAAYSLFMLIDRVSAVDPSNQPADAPTLADTCRGELEFDNVHFRYPSRPKVKVHRGLSFKVPAGAKAALVGASGCGKSTCIQQLERFYDPTQGRILIDGVDITAMNVVSLRTHISLVGQEPMLFDGTIIDNIKYGAVDPSKVTDEDAYEAARNADVHAFIMSLPQGYQTPVGEKGGMLSGGQKQRVSIARSLMRNPKILLLDEATSALDAESEVAVQKALDAASRGRTTISIAHRLSTVVNSDIIFVLHKGKVVESGTHKQLISQHGHYFKLVEAQMDMH
ncbi:P-glycoprotein [Blastocladiella britannica]|nr:P-glycoprotein [Blastocladiella britannica]